MAISASLFRHPDFLKLWTAETISAFGSQFSPIAIQYAATVILSATAIQFGLLSSLATLSFLLFGLPVGVWADRHRRKRTMVFANVGRAALLFTIPLSAFAGYLSMNLFYFVAFFSGTLTVFFDICYQSYLPSLVDRSQLVDANSKLQTSAATAQTFGPALAGIVVQFVSAILAIFGDVIGYFGSAFFLFSIKKQEPTIAARPGRSVWQDVREGLGVVFGERRLRSIAGCTATSNLFSSAYGAILFPYLIRILGFSPFEIGLVFSTGAVGGIVAAIISRKASQFFGVGWSIIIFALVFGVGQVPLYIATRETAFPLLIVSFFITSVGAVIYNVTQVSFRQAIVPIELQGRMNATMRTIVWGTLPIGGLMGGLLAQAFGYHTAIGIGVAGAAVAFLWVLFSPVRQVRDFPSAPNQTDKR